MRPGTTLSDGASVHLIIDKKRPSEEFACCGGILHTILGLCSSIRSVSVKEEYENFCFVSIE